MKKLYTFLGLVCFASAFAQTTYKTISVGDWDNPARWENGAIPPDNIGVNDVVIIEHNTGIENKEITNNGTIRITATLGYEYETHIVNKGKVIVATGGMIYTRHTSASSFVNDYAIDNSGVIWNVEQLTNNGYIFNQGYIYNYQKLFYDGVSMNCSDAGRIVNNNVICNNGEGYIDQDCGSTTSGNEVVTGCSTLRDEIMNASLGLNNAFQQQFSVSPNPTNGLVTINFSSPLSAEIELFDTTGKKVFATIKISTDHASIDLSTLNSGVYFAKISSDNQTAVKKIVRL